MSALLCTAQRVTLALAGCIGLSSCNPAPPSTEFWRPWYEAPTAPDEDDGGEPDLPPDLAAADLGGPVDLLRADAADGSTMPGNCSLAITVTTSSAGGRYSPRNIGAIWVSDSSNRFIKTLNVWADKRAKYLKQWNQATAAASVPASRTDAISGATKSSHGVRTGTWNCTNTASVARCTSTGLASRLSLARSAASVSTSSRRTIVGPAAADSAIDCENRSATAR